MLKMHEPLRQEAVRCESAEELLPRIRSLRRADKIRLLSWIEQGQRSREPVDVLFDKFRILPEPQRRQVEQSLKEILSRG